MSFTFTFVGIEFVGNYCCNKTIVVNITGFLAFTNLSFELVVGKTFHPRQVERPFTR